MFQRNELRSVWGIPADAKVILAVNKLVPREGAFDLLQAFAAIVDEYTWLWLVIVGDGEQMELMQEYVRTRATPRVIFTGYQPYTRLVEFYTLADVFVHPGRVESWGVSVNEAMACGLPIIASDRVGSAYDLVKQGENGFIFRAGDVHSLQKTLVHFIQSETQHSSMGKMSRQIIQQWGYDFTIQEILRVLEYVTTMSMDPMQSTHE